MHRTNTYAESQYFLTPNLKPSKTINIKVEATPNK